MGVYFALSALDFPFCYLLVRYVGTERVGEIEHYISSHVSQVIPQGVKDGWERLRAAFKRNEEKALNDGGKISVGVEMAGWGVAKADEAHKAEASKLLFPVFSEASRLFVPAP